MTFAHVLSSSDDENFASVVNRRPNNIRKRPAHFYELDNVDFRVQFRLSKECITEVLEAEISFSTKQYT